MNDPTYDYALLASDLFVGAMLPNGATVMAWCVLSKADIVLLCQWRGDYVSWVADPADLQSTCHGHYSGSDRASAVAGFGARIEDRLCYIRDNCTSYHTEGESHHA